MSISRRMFLQHAAVIGTVGTARSSGGAPAGSTEAVERKQPAAFELDEWTIPQFHEAMRSGRYTARRITELYLARIEALDRDGPTLNSVLELNPEALAIADALDAERKAKGPRGPLHGIPVLIKDNIDTADRMLTTAGSLALVGSAPQRDAFIVERLRAAGAIILGKTNLSEWANFRSLRSSSGWSARGGQGRNPYALDRNPCGSSSGSGAAIAANFAAGAIGTETDGSIVCPSAANSIVGLKPTVGLASRAGIIPIAHTQDTAGPMTRTVTDAAILLGVLAAPDPRDPATTGAGARRLGDHYTTRLDKAGLRGARIGVAREKFFGYSQGTDRIIDEAIDEMRRQGAVIIDPANIPHAGSYDESEFEVLLYEFKTDLNQYLSTRGPGAQIRSLKDLIEFNERHRDREMPYFGQEILIKSQEKGPLSAMAYRQARARNRRLSRTEGIDSVMRSHRLDAIVAPTGNPPWPIDLVNGDHFLGSSSTPAAVSGYPSVTVPAGYVFGLPVGISFIGRAYSESTLIRLAYAYEQATRVRRPPQFLPTAPL